MMRSPKMKFVFDRKKVGTRVKEAPVELCIRYDELKCAAKHYIEDTGIDNNMSSMFEQIKQAAKKNPNIWKQMASWFSKVSPVVGALYSFDNKNKEQ